MLFLIVAIILALPFAISLPVEQQLAPYHQYQDAEEGHYMVKFKNASHSIERHLSDI